MIEREKQIETFYIEDFKDVKRIHNETFERCIFTTKNNENRQQICFPIEKCTFKNVKFVGNFNCDLAFVDCKLEEITFAVPYNSAEFIRCDIAYTGITLQDERIYCKFYECQIKGSLAFYPVYPKTEIFISKNTKIDKCTFQKGLYFSDGQVSVENSSFLQEIAKNNTFDKSWAAKNNLLGSYVINQNNVIKEI